MNIVVELTEQEAMVVLEAVSKHPLPLVAAQPVAQKLAQAINEARKVAAPPAKNKRRRKSNGKQPSGHHSDPKVEQPTA